MMTFDEIRSVAAKLESDIANGPIVPTVTPDEIRRHLAARYDFTKPLDPDEVGADVDAMLRTWQVHVTHPRYFGLFNPSVTVASIVADTLVAMYNPQLATWRTAPTAARRSGWSGPPAPRGRARSTPCRSWRAFAARRTSGFTSMPRGAVPPSSRRVSGVIWPASTRPIRSRATHTNGSRCRWAPGCSFAGIARPSARRFARRPRTCRARRRDRLTIRTRHRCNGLDGSSGSSSSWLSPSTANPGTSR